MRIIFFVVLLYLSGMSYAASLNQNDKWHAFQESFTTLIALFEQITDDEISRGKLILDKSSRSLRIDILSPRKQTITLLDGTVTFYNKPIRAANVIKYEPNAFIELLLGNIAFIPMQKDNNTYTFDSIEIVFDDVAPKQITRFEEGEFITVKFTEFDRDAAINPEIFKIILPDSVDVIAARY